MSGITAYELHRLVYNVARVITHPIDEEALGTTRSREALVEWADQYDLDLQDTATLYRVASGESSERRS